MKKKKIRRIILYGLVCFVMLGSLTKATSEGSRAVLEERTIYKPQLNEGKKWRIAYVLMDESSVYVNALDNLVKGLRESGWLDADEESWEKYPENSALEVQTINIWKWLRAEDTNHYLHFVESYYPAGDYEEYINRFEAFAREQVVPGLIEDKIDLVVVMGDRAAYELMNAGCQTKMMVLGTSDPVGLGIVENQKASGKKTVWAHIDQDKYVRQMEMFYNTFHFRNIGIIYDNPKETLNEAYSVPTREELSDKKLTQVKEAIQIKAFEEVARKNDFQLFLKNVDDNSSVETHMQEAVNELSESSEAIYLAHYKNGNGIDVEKLMAPCYKRNVLSFYEAATKVHEGMLMSATNLEDKGAQIFYAETLGKLLIEEDFSDIKQEYVIPPQIILNLEAARKSGIDLDFELIMAADQIILHNESE